MTSRRKTVEVAFQGIFSLFKMLIISLNEYSNSYVQQNALFKNHINMHVLSKGLHTPTPYKDTKEKKITMLQHYHKEITSLQCVIGEETKKIIDSTFQNHRTMKGRITHQHRCLSFPAWCGLLWHLTVQGRGLPL